LQLTDDTAIQLNQGVDAETIEEAMAEFKELNDIFYFITLDTEYNDTSTSLDLSTWTFTRPYMYFTESSDTQALVTNDTTSIPAQLFAQQSERTSCDWTPAASTTSGLYTENLSLSSAAKLSGGVNFNGSNSVINAALKKRPLIEASTLTTTQSTELDRKRVNRYVPIGGDTVSQTVRDIYEWGYCCANGIWQDIRYGVDWLVNAIQVDVLDGMLETDLIPQTIQGQMFIKGIIENTCKQGIINGLLAPGETSAIVTNQIITKTGNTDYNGTLANGYLVYPMPLSTMSEAERVARKLPIFYVWVKGSGAVNNVDIVLAFDQ